MGNLSTYLGNQMAIMFEIRHSVQDSVYLVIGCLNQLTNSRNQGPALPPRTSQMNDTFFQIEGRAASRISVASMHGLQGDGLAGDPLPDDGQAVPDPAGLLRQPQPQLSQRRSILVLTRASTQHYEIC